MGNSIGGPMIQAATILRWVSCACAISALALSLRTAARLREPEARGHSPEDPMISARGDSPEVERLRVESRELLERVKALPLQGPGGEESLTTGQLKAAVQEALDRRERDALRQRLAEGFAGVQKENRDLLSAWKAASGPGPELADLWSAAQEKLDNASRLAAQEALSVADYRRRILEARGEAESFVDSWLTPEQRDRKARVGFFDGPH